MIDNDTKAPDRAVVAGRVRQNVLSAGIAAAMMLWYGYSRLQISDGAGAWGLGDKISIYTLRFGGIAMVIAALWSAAGSRWALLFDGACSALIGVLFGLSGILLTTGGGSGFLYVIFGMVFLLGGVSNVREWLAFAPASEAGAARPVKAPDPRTLRPQDVMPTDSLAGRLRDGRQQDNHRTQKPPPLDAATPPPVPKAPPKPAEDDKPPPEGFLSSFAPEQDDSSANG